MQGLVLAAGGTTDSVMIPRGLPSGSPGLRRRPLWIRTLPVGGVRHGYLGEGQGGAGLTGGPSSSPPPVLVTMGKLRSGKGKVGPRPHRDVGASWAKAPHATPQVLSLRSVSDGNHG